LGALRGSFPKTHLVLMPFPDFEVPQPMRFQQLLEKTRRLGSSRQADRRAGVLTRAIFAALAIAASSSVCLWGQNTEATILGTVRDPSGLAVSSAKVQLVNRGTGTQRTETTDNNGDFRFSAVDVGTYVLEIDAVGFQKAQFTQFDVLARESRRLLLIRLFQLAPRAWVLGLERSAAPVICL
jgi:hypothetical protein